MIRGKTRAHNRRHIPGPKSQEPAISAGEADIGSSPGDSL